MESSPLTVELLGAASSGKSKQIELFQEAFRTRGVTTVTLSAENLAYKHLREFLRSEEKRCDLHRFPEFVLQNAKKRSLVFQAILLSVMQAAESAIEQVVLIEQGPIYDFVVESCGLEVPEYVLEYYLGDIKQPHEVIFLDVPVDELRKREATRMLWDRENLGKICEGLARAYRDNPYWLRVDGTLPQDEVFACAWAKIWDLFERHRESPLSRREINFGP